MNLQTIVNISGKEYAIDLKFLILKGDKLNFCQFFFRCREMSKNVTICLWE